MPARTLATRPSSKTSSPQPAKRCAAQPQSQAVLYARVSSKDQEKEGFSIPAQQRLLREYALEKDLAIPKEFIDVETAKESGRAGFAEMLAYLKKHACRTILVEKTDRLYRNLKDWSTLDELGVTIHFVNENAKEWEQVVDAWQLESWEAYRDVVRLGRKTRLAEKQRVVLWSIFEVVRLALKTRGLVTYSDMFNRMASQLAQSSHQPFDFACVDEAQDVSVPQLRFLAT